MVQWNAQIRLTISADFVDLKSKPTQVKQLQEKFRNDLFLCDDTRNDFSGKPQTIFVFGTNAIALQTAIRKATEKKNERVVEQCQNKNKTFKKLETIILCIYVEC